MKLLTALEKHNPNKPIAPIDLLNNYDKPWPLPSQNKPIYPPV